MISAVPVLDYLPYVIALAISCVIPGPGVAASVGKALGAGFGPAMFFITGLTCGDLVFLTAAVLGLSAIATSFSGVLLAIKLAGAAYLCWLAWSFWHAGIDPVALRTSRGSGAVASFAGGFAVTMGNPKTIIFYMALLPTVVDLEAVTFERYLLLAALTVAVIYAVCIPYIALAAQARRLLTRPRALKALNRGAAAAMAGAAAYIVARG